MRSFSKYALKAALWIGGVVLIAFGVLRLFFMDVVVIGHDSMAPTLIAGDQAFLWRGGDDAEMGDIVVCQHPQHAGQMVVGRVLGRSNMTVKTVRGLLDVSGTRPSRDIKETVDFRSMDSPHPIRVQLSEDTLGNFTHHTFWPDNHPLRLRETRVPVNHYYLLGDNRTQHGNDSRTFGTVPANTCIGKLFMLMKPAPDPRGNPLDRGWFDIL